MIQVTVDEIKLDLPIYLQLVEAGKTIVITKAGVPMAELTPAMPTIPVQRPYGLCAGEFAVPDDFDSPLPENVIAGFEGR
jgi:antitoxin (DNA-binding transcriptional repressor) of toxin-antitoxin stability system